MDYESNKSYIEMRSAGMSVAAMIMGILGLVMSCCVYPAIVFGSLAIIFALLSRGGEMHTNGYAKAGLILGIIGIVCGILFLTYSFFTLLVQFGGWEGYLNYIEELMQEMGYTDSVSPYDFYDTL
jgi:hypothetical protein